MAEYYETGAASDVNDMLGKLRNAMTLHGGYTMVNNELESGGGYRSHLSKGNLKVNLHTGFNNSVPVPVGSRGSRFGSWEWGKAGWLPAHLAINLSTSFNNSLSWNNQPGAPGSTEGQGYGLMFLVASIISRYWLFILEDPDAVFLVVETRPNCFEFIAFGNLVMTQAVESGGEWFAGSRQINKSYGGLVDPFWGRYNYITGVSVPNTQEMLAGRAFHRLVDSRWTVEDQWDGWGRGVFSGSTPRASAPSSAGAFTPNYVFPSFWSETSDPYYNQINQSYIESEGRSIIHPIAAYKYVPSGITLLGYIPHIARLSMRPYLPGDPVLGVGETYLAFPGHKRAVPWTTAGYGSSPTNLNDEAYNYHGTGYCIRRP